MYAQTPPAEITVRALPIPSSVTIRGHQVQSTSMIRKTVRTRRGSSHHLAMGRGARDFGPLAMRDVLTGKAAPPGELQRALKAATRADHVSLDALILRLNLKSQKDYCMFLQMHQAALQSLQSDWRGEEQKDFSALLKCASDDLSGLGSNVAPLNAISHSVLLGGQRLGLAYVVYGSRLGASILRRRVPAAFPSTYLDFSPSLSWPQFLLELDRAHDEGDRALTYEAIRGARFTFNVFAAFLRQAAS
jgi:heme oxygenase (biliverdin-IX-beta and delta-forming)